MIEQKKSPAADLESRRPMTLAVAFCAILLLFIVVLHIPFSDTETYLSTDVVDELTEELELLPSIDQSEMVAAIQETPTANTADQIRVVDETEAKLMEEAQTTVAMTLSEAEELSRDVRHNPVVLPVAIDKDDKPLDFRIVQQLPEFPGGMVAFVQWLTKNLKYPDKARSQRLQGRVLVQFVVNRDGSVADVKVAETADPLLDAEALRVMRMMPQWKAGIQYGKPCRTMVAVPVVFKL